MITLASHRDLTREAVEAVAWAGEPLALAPAALERVAAGQAGLAALPASGARVHGVTTGAGWLASVDLGREATGDHQRNLLLGRAVGGGRRGAGAAGGPARQPHQRPRRGRAGAVPVPGRPGQRRLRPGRAAARGRLRRVGDLAREVVACELLAVRQAWWLRRRPPAPGLGPLAACLAELVSPVDRDRPLGPDLDRLIGVLARDELPLPWTQRPGRGQLGVWTDRSNASAAGLPSPTGGLDSGGRGSGVVRECGGHPRRYAYCHARRCRDVS
jgi:Aromatic amino acid lyase